MSFLQFIFLAACYVDQTGSSCTKAFIETERLLIESYKPCHLQKSISLYSDPEITRFYDSGKPKSVPMILSFVETYGIKPFQQGKKLGLFSIFIKDTCDFVGHIDLTLFDETSETLEIGYILSKQYQGQGLGTEAAYAMIFEYIPYLQDLGYYYKKVIATAHPQNVPSQKVLQKIGFIFEKEQNRFNQPRYWYSLDLMN
jgi:RimJ/RimL family protein N-acetyltransferase